MQRLRERKREATLSQRICERSLSSTHVHVSLLRKCGYIKLPNAPLKLLKARMRAAHSGGRRGADSRFEMKVSCFKSHCSRVVTLCRSLRQFSPKRKTKFIKCSGVKFILKIQKTLSHSPTRARATTSDRISHVEVHRTDSKTVTGIALHFGPDERERD